MVQNFAYHIDLSIGFYHCVLLYCAYGVVSSLIKSYINHVKSVINVYTMTYYFINKTQKKKQPHQPLLESHHAIQGCTRVANF